MKKSEYEKALQTLRANASDSLEEIRRKYHTLLQKYHPDINSDPDAEEISKQLTLAYNYIKKHYEEYRRNAKFDHNTQRQEYYEQSSKNPRYDKSKRKSSVNLKNYNQAIIIVLCAQLGIDEETARSRAGANSMFGIESDDLRVLKYLRNQIEIRELCTRLGITQSQAEDEFRTKIGYEYSDNKFIKWLKKQARIQDLCTRLGTTPNQAEDEFITKIGYGYSDDEFIKWLQAKISVIEFCDKLKVLQEELKKIFETTNISLKDQIKIFDTVYIIEEELREIFEAPNIIEEDLIKIFETTNISEEELIKIFKATNISEEYLIKILTTINQNKPQNTSYSKKKKR